MNFSECLLLDCQRLLQEFRSLVVALLKHQRARENGQIDRGLRIVLTVPALHDCQRLPVVLLRFGVMP